MDPSRKIALGYTKTLFNNPRKITGLFQRDEIGLLKDLVLGKDYIEANRQRMNKRVKNHPFHAVGGEKDVFNKLYLDYLKSEGLKPNHNFLDIGCGTLRIGLGLIEYLGENCYTGIDISGEAIKYAEDLIHKEDLEQKNPVLKKTNGRDLKPLSDLYDYILAQSVFTHLPRNITAKYFGELPLIMTQQSKVYATFWIGEKYKVKGPSSFQYSEEYLRDLADKEGLNVSRRKGFQHPRGQSLFVFTLD